MERNIAILMADLTGYTAMTEIHGALSAATMVEKYLELAGKSMIGKSRLLERAGDQLVIVSESADDITYTALRLLEHTAAENNFLHIHAGLHYGPVLEQSGSFYGSSMNLTARIAALAKRNSILCSVDFTRSLTDAHQFSFQHMGEVRLKNIKSPVAIAALLPFTDSLVGQKHTDPVCHMTVDADTPLRYSYNQTVYHFCSTDCLEIFRNNPEQILQH